MAAAAERDGQRGRDREDDRDEETGTRTGRGPGPGIAAVRALRADGPAGAAQVVRLLRQHPDERDEILAWLQQHRGNAFVQQVMQHQGEVERAMPEGVELESVMASVTIPGNRRFHGDWKASVGTTRPTRVTAEISRTGVRISLSPSLHVDATWPLQNADIKSAGIDFTRGRAFANVTDGRGLGSGMLSIKDQLVDMITDKLDAGIAGTPLARPGYDPTRDRDLSGTLQRVVQGFQSLVSEDEHAGDDGGRRAPVNQRELDDVSVGATVTARAGARSMQNGAGLVVAPGSSLTVEAEGDGSVGDIAATRSPGAAAQAARIRAIRLHASDMQVHAKGEPVVKIGSLTIAPGGRVRIDEMQLLGRAAEARRTEGGLAAIVGILALAAGDRRTAAGAIDYAQDPRIVDGLTRSTIEREFTSCVQRMILEHRGVVPGVDLAQVLGVS